MLIEATIVQPLLAAAGLHAEESLEYTRDARDAIERVRRGEADVAVLVNPTRVEQVAAVALAGERMPEKSTFFVPKAPNRPGSATAGVAARHRLPARSAGPWGWGPHGR